MKTTKPSRNSEKSIREEAFAPGGIVVVPFPFSDRLAEKRRPALIVSQDGLLAHGHVWLCMITSSRHGSHEYDVPVTDHESCGLVSPCIVRPSKIATVEVSRIIRKAGQLPDDDFDKVLVSLAAILGLKRSRKP